MLPGAESTSGWTKGMRRPYTVAAEAMRMLVGVLVAVSLVFVALRVLSGNPALGTVPHNPQYAGLAQQNIAIFALDQPLWAQYFVWIFDVFTGRLGISYYYRIPVMDLVASRVAVTVELLLGTTLWALLVGTPLGWVASSPRGRIRSALSHGAALVLYAVPVFWSCLLLLVGVYDAWRTSLGSPFSIPTAIPRVTGFLTIDALLSGNLSDFWLALWTTALLTLPGGIAFSYPVAMRVRNALRERTQSAETPDPSRPPGQTVRKRLWITLAANAGSLAVLMPFLLSAVILEEWMGGRQGLGFLVIQAVDRLDAILLQGIVAILLLLALAAATPFALLGAAFLRRPRPVVVVPGTVPDERAFMEWFRRIWSGLFKRSAIPFWIGFLLVAAILVLTYGASLFTPYGPLQRVTDTACSQSTPPLTALQPPCPTHPLGTDYFAQDIFSQVLYGGQYLIAETLPALAVSAGIGAGLALVCAYLGRFADVPLRVALGAFAVLPVLAVVLLLLVTSATFSFLLALTIVFVPILFRDARDLVAKVEWPRPLFGPGGLPGGLVGRFLAAVAAIGPGLTARLPRRLAEMGLLVETLTLFGLSPPNVVDWARTTSSAIESNAILYNLPWIVVPGIMLFLYTLGLLALSVGLRGILTSDSRGGVSEPAPPVPAKADSFPSTGTP